MGLLEKAYETYQCHKHLAGKVEEGKSPLIPVAHIIQNIQIEVCINTNGEFVSANIIDKNDSASIIPVTIESGSRSGKYPPAHPLCDKIQYVNKDDTWQYREYIDKLGKWKTSLYSDLKLDAIFSYTQNNSIKKDLDIYGITFKDNDMVRWRVIGQFEDYTTACWQDQVLFEKWKNYYIENMHGEHDLCMLTGECTVISDSHPKGIVAANNNSKLISANDSQNFTYRGRFCTSHEALTVGYLPSQYVHNVLTWLTRNQGVRYVVGGRIFICWNPKGFTLPQGWRPFILETPEIEPSNYKKKLLKSISGYKNDLPINEDVVIAAFDAATTGRLSLTYYSELKGHEFISRLEHWYSSCLWYNGKFGLQNPLLDDIVKCAYGISNLEGNKFEVNEKIHREQFQRMLQCITEKAVLPADIVVMLTNKASRPQAYKNSHSSTYIKLLFVTCALIRKYHNERLKREEYALKLEKDKKDRSYQFGRLLAVMERVELTTFDSDEQREANAIRLQSAFCERPMHYTEIIHQKLAPYFAKQKPGARRYFKKLIGEIMAIIAEYPESELNKKLADTYLLGYYLQRNVFYEKYDAKNNEVKEGDE